MTDAEIPALLKDTAKALVEEINRNQASGLLSRDALVLTSRLEHALRAAAVEPTPALPRREDGEPL